MDYIRRHSQLRRGQRVLQVAFGSGFKCNSAVWLCLNNPPLPPIVPATVHVHAEPAVPVVAAASTTSTAAAASSSAETRSKDKKRQ